MLLGVLHEDPEGDFFAGVLLRRRTPPTARYPLEPGDDIADDLEGGEIAVVKVGRDDTLTKILVKSGAPLWQARAMVEAAQNTFPELALTPGQEVRITLVPSLTQANANEPARFSLFSDGHDHLVTVARNAAGEFVASAQSTISQELRQASPASKSAARSMWP